MKYGIAKHHIHIEGMGDFTPGEVVPARVMDAIKGKKLERLVRLGAVELCGDAETEDSSTLSAEDKKAEQVDNEAGEQAAEDEHTAEDADDGEAFEPIELDDEDDIIEPEEEKPTAARKATGRKAKKEAK